jgi:hypothetical protein
VRLPARARRLIEQEDASGRPVLRLLVHPRLGRLDAATVASAFLDAIASPSSTDRVMALMWRAGELLTVERRPPLTTPSGKVLHLHLERPRS